MGQGHAHALEQRRLEAKAKADRLLDTFRNPNEPLEVRLAAFDGIDRRALSEHGRYSLGCYEAMVAKLVAKAGEVSAGGVTYHVKAGKILRRMT